MREKGSFTVEATIVMSAIIMIIFAIISAFLLLYQNVVITYVAQQAAQQGAIMWADTSVQLDGTRQGRDEQGYYYRLGEFGGGSAAKKAKIAQWARDKLAEMMPQSAIGSGAEQVNVHFRNTFFQRFVEVEIRKEIDIPIADVMQYFGDDLDISVKVRAAVSEPAEYIRTIDLGYIVALDLWDMVAGKWSTIKSWFKS